MSAEWGPIDRLIGQAEALAGAWGARARASTSPGFPEAGAEGCSWRSRRNAPKARWIASWISCVPSKHALRLHRPWPESWKMRALRPGLGYAFSEMDEK